MYIGERPSGKNLVLDGTTKPVGSYAAEVEGLTLVRGKFANNKLGNSWSNNGLRMGAVGFGSMFRPATGSKALGVGGLDSNIASIKTGGAGGTTASVGAWDHGAFVGQGTSDDIHYTAQLVGGRTNWQSNAGRASVVGKAGNWDPQPGVEYGVDATTALTVNGVDYTDYTTSIASASAGLARMNAFKMQDGEPFTTDAESNGRKPGVYVGDAPAGTATRHHYDNGGIKVSFTFNKGSEKLITFNGDGKSLMQVFNVPASALSTDGFSGLDFAFTNIPDGTGSHGDTKASVAINIVGTDAVTFQGGWRFWWNGLEIGDGYVTDKITEVTDNRVREAYSIAAKTVLWNFAKTPDLSIVGGSFRHVTSTNNGNPGAHLKGKDGDDPSSAFLGTILVPNGSFDDHVTTNGRVWVGVDFMMNNPTLIGTYNGSQSASILGMDQERHNFPWFGSVSEECSTISWVKVGDRTTVTDAETGATLAGSSWGVYESLPDAVEPRNALYRVEDNVISSGDMDPVTGRFRVSNLKPDTTYFIREIAAPDGYRLNTNIYAIATTNTGDTTNRVISAVYSSKGKPITTADDQLLNHQVSDVPPLTGKVPGIVNVEQGADVNWGKTEAGDAKHKPLEGSTWTLTDVTDPQNPQQWEIIDNIIAPTAVRITLNGTNVLAGGTVTLSEGTELQLGATVQPKGTPQAVEWSSSDARLGVQDGRVQTVGVVPEGGFTGAVTATSENDPSIHATVNVRVGPVGCSSLTVMFEGEKNPSTIELNVSGGEKALTATTNPEGLAVAWESSNESVVTVNGGVLTPHKAGEARVTATCRNRTHTVTVRVRDNRTRVYFAPSIIPYDGTPYLVYNVNGKWISQAVEMQPYAKCSGRQYYVYPVQAHGGAFEFYFAKSADRNNELYRATGGSFFKVQAGVRDLTVTRWDSTVNEPPLNCAVPSPDAIAERGFADAVAPLPLSEEARVSLRGGVRVESSEPKSARYVDSDSAYGRLRLRDLPPGKYTLVEQTAPDGYWCNPATYQFTVADGAVEWTGTTRPEFAESTGATGWIGNSPTKIEWSKMDRETGQILGGTSWNLQQQVDGEWKTLNVVTDCTKAPCKAESEDVQYYDADPEPGAFRVERLPVGTYGIVEQPMEGYHPHGHRYTFTVDGTLSIGGVALASGAKQVADDAIGNWRQLGSVGWSKISALDMSQESKPLAGSEWTFTFTPRAHDGGGQPVVCVMADDGSECEQGGKRMSELPQWATDINPAAGEFQYDGLPWGSYTLQERKAPAGYELDTQVHEFAVGPGAPATQENKYVESLGALRDAAGVELPGTGGEGMGARQWAAVAGLVLVTLAVIALDVVMRRRAR